MALQNLPGAGVETASGVAVLQLPSQASALLYHPVRLRILEALLAPDSAAGLSRRNSAADLELSCARIAAGEIAGAGGAAS